jgi:hypothetical protein
MDYKNKKIKLIHNSKAIGSVIPLSKKSSKDNNVKDLIYLENVLDQKTKKIMDLRSMVVIIETPVEFDQHNRCLLLEW